MRQPEKLDINMDTFAIRLKPHRRALAMAMGLGMIGITILPPLAALCWLGWIPAMLALVPCGFLFAKGIPFWGIFCVVAAIDGEWPILI
jgi:hypothetical protein